MFMNYPFLCIACILLLMAPGRGYQATLFLDSSMFVWFVNLGAMGALSGAGPNIQNFNPNQTGGGEVHPPYDIKLCVNYWANFLCLKLRL